MKFFFSLIIIITQLVLFTSMTSNYQNNSRKNDADSSVIKYIKQLIHQNKTDSAFIIISQEEFKEHSRSFYVQLQILKAENYEANNLFKKAALYYNQAYLKLEDEQDSLRWDCLINTITSNCKSSEFDKNEPLFVEADHLLKMYPSKEKEANLLNIKSIMYRQMGMFQRALSIIDSAISINMQLNDDVKLSVNYTSKGNIYFHKEDYGLAYEYFKKAYETGFEHKTTKRKIKNKLNIASALHRRGSLDLAKKTYAEILSSKNKAFISPETKAGAYYNFGVLYYETYNIPQSMACLDSSIFYSIEIGRFYNLKLAYDMKARLFAENNDFQNAYRNALIVNEYNDSIKQGDLLKVMRNLELNNANKGREFNMQIDRLLVHYNEKTKRNILLFLVVFILTGIIVFILVRKKYLVLLSIHKRQLNSMKHKHQLFLQIHKKSQQIDKLNKSFKLDIKRSSFLLYEVLGLFKKLEKQFQNTKNLPEPLRKLHVQINNMADNIRSSDLINEHPEKEEADLKNRLKHFFPDLKRNELKLCLLIHMQMSNKEIASYTNTTPGSVEVAKYRLRKKLGFSTMSEFVQELNQI